MGYIADYLLHRITMPDQDGNILQPDVTQPGVQVISSTIPTSNITTYLVPGNRRPLGSSAAVGESRSY